MSTEWAPFVSIVSAMRNGLKQSLFRITTPIWAAAPAQDIASPHRSGKLSLRRDPYPPWKILHLSLWGIEASLIKYAANYEILAVCDIQLALRQRPS